MRAVVPIQVTLTGVLVTESSSVQAYDLMLPLFVPGVVGYSPHQNAAEALAARKNFLEPQNLTNGLVRRWRRPVVHGS
jgi:hypothetical protein